MNTTSSRQEGITWKDVQLDALKPEHTSLQALSGVVRPRCIEVGLVCLAAVRLVRFLGGLYSVLQLAHVLV